jgi:tyrosinase
MTDLTRRMAILGLTGTAAGLLNEAALGQPVNNLSTLIDRFGIEILRVPPRVVRRVSAASLPANHRVLESFRQAITAMIALPSSDPRNWTRIATVHQDFCAHRNWYTWPWHRAYLTSFERVCRQLSGDDEFRVPYWDWTANRQIPATFSDPIYNGAPNPLFHARTRSPTDSLPDTVVGPGVISAIVGEPDFEEFMSHRPSGQNNTDPRWQRVGSVQGPLEYNPHNTIHPWVGGDMASFMSPLDPIFWLHHANLDRIWDQWNRLGHSNTTDPLWRNFRFNEFVNPGRFTPVGTPWAPHVSELLDIEALGYTYIRRFSPFDIIAVGSKILPKIDPGRIERAKIEIDRGATASLMKPLGISLKGPASVEQLVDQVLRLTTEQGDSVGKDAELPTLAGRVIAIVEVEPPAELPPVVRVFLNCDYLSPETPAEDPHYVGSFSFFMNGHGNHGRSQQSVFVSLDLTLTLLALQDAGRLPAEELILQLQPVALDEENEQQREPSAINVLSVEVAVT